MDYEQTASAVRFAMAKAGKTAMEVSVETGYAESSIFRFRRKGCDSVKALSAIAKSCGMSLTEMIELVED